MTTAREIEELRYLAQDDRRCAAAGFIDINPFSTQGARALWQAGFDGVRPGLLVDGSTNWRYWERGRQARLLCDEANNQPTTPP